MRIIKLSTTLTFYVPLTFKGPKSGTVTLSHRTHCLYSTCNAGVSKTCITELPFTRAAAKILEVVVSYDCEIQYLRRAAHDHILMNQQCYF